MHDAAAAQTAYLAGTMTGTMAAQAPVQVVEEDVKQAEEPVEAAEPEVQTRPEQSIHGDDDAVEAAAPMGEVADDTPAAVDAPAEEAPVEEAKAEDAPAAEAAPVEEAAPCLDVRSGCAPAEEPAAPAEEPRSGRLNAGAEIEEEEIAEALDPVEEARRQRRKIVLQRVRALRARGQRAMQG